MSQPKFQNRLLAALPSDSLRRVQQRLEWIDLSFKLSLIEAERRIEHIYFPESGVCSTVMHGGQGATVEVATIGREGFVGTSVLLGSDETAASTFCQIPGAAFRMTVADFRDMLDADAPFRLALLRSTQALMMQMAQGATCNRLHNIEERAARWLLQTRDRVDEDVFPLTQEFLAQMLGVRRQAVNVAAGMLQQAGLITYSRGMITILDRPGLEAASCECYYIIRGEQERLTGR